MRKWVAGLLLVVALPSPAQAGGALWDLNQEFYVPGDVVRAESGVWLKSAQGRLEDGPFYAYVTGSYPERLPPLPDDAIRVDEVAVQPRPGSDHGDAAVEFELPSLPPGKHYLLTCNDPCKLPLGDLMPTALFVAASPEEGRTAVAVNRLSWRIRSLRIVLGNRVLGHRPESLRSRVAALERELVGLSEELADLRAAAARREGPPVEESSTTSSLPSLLAFVVPAALLGIVLGRRHDAA